MNGPCVKSAWSKANENHIYNRSTTTNFTVLCNRSSFKLDEKGNDHHEQVTHEPRVLEEGTTHGNEMQQHAHLYKVRGQDSGHEETGQVDNDQHGVDGMAPKMAPVMSMTSSTSGKAKAAITVYATTRARRNV